MICLAVRSGFDLLLEALALPEGSEVLLSAITVPDMERIVRAHGLVPVPLDVDPETLQPDAGALRQALSPRTRVVVAAHLFGAVVDLREVRNLASTHGLVFVEDCAQSFIPESFHGDPESDVRMLSFGPIKTSSALGGGVLFVRDPELRARMEAIHETRPVQGTRTFVRRVLKYAGLRLLGHRWPFVLFLQGCRLLGRDFDEVLRQAARGFRGDDLMGRLRHRPTSAALALLARRLERPNPRVLRRIEAGQALARQVAGKVERPGASVARHAHWVFPVLARDPHGLVAHLRACGFDATHGASSLTVVRPAPERPDVRCPRAETIVDRILFVPAYPEVPASGRVRLGEALVEWARREGSLPSAPTPEARTA